MILRNYDTYKVHACVYEYMKYNLYHSQATISTLSDRVLTPTHTSIMSSPSSTMPTQSTDEGSGVLLVYISAGVSVAVVVLVTTAVNVISVSVCLRKKKKKKDKHVNTTENVAYHYGNGNGLEMMQVNDAYGSVDAVSQTNNTDIVTSVNDAYLAMHELGLSEEHQYATIPATIV